MPSAKTGKKTITSISKGKKKGTVNIHLGKEKMVLSYDTYSEYRLYVGMEVSEALLKSIKKKNDDEALYSYALSLASKFAYSTHDVEEKLKMRSDDHTQIWRIIYRLKDAGFLIDEDFALQYKEEKEAAGYGKRRIQDELIHKHGVKREIVDSLPFLDGRERAKELVASYQKSYSSYPLKAQKEKIFAALVRKGFSESEASYAIEGLKEDQAKVKEKLKREAILIIAKMKKKYSGYELREHVYASLLAKGYNSGDIADILKKESL